MGDGVRHDCEVAFNLKAPKYRWVCYNCKKENDPGIATCIHCRFSANARGAEIEIAENGPPKQDASNKKETGITADCPQCQAKITIPLKFGLSEPFVCSGCGVTLDSNHNLLLVVTLVIWISLVIASYQRWPMFIFLMGDWLLLILVGLGVYLPFHKVTAINLFEK